MVWLHIVKLSNMGIEERACIVGIKAMTTNRPPSSDQA